MPACPIDAKHGQMFSWGDRKRSNWDWLCKHSDHGGNGLFVTNGMLEGGQTVASQVEEALSAILSGTLTIDDAVEIVARRTNLTKRDIRSYLETRVRTAANFARAKAERSEPRAVYTAPRRKREAVPSLPPAEFMRVMTDAGLSKKEAAEAIGRSVSRVHELTTTQGGNQKLFDNFVAQIAAYVANRAKEG